MHPDLVVADLTLNATAGGYDLLDRAERTRSASDLTNLFLRISAAVQPEVILEIGARQAAYSRVMKRRLPDTPVIAFEATPHNFEKFGPSNVALGVEYLNLAVCDQDQKVEFMVQARRNGIAVRPDIGSNSLNARLDDGVEYDPVSVQGVRIDSFLRERSITGPITAWIDVEGALRAVLEGFGETMTDLQAVLCEVEDVPKWKGQWIWPDVFEFFRQHDMIPIARDFEYANQHNVIFVKRTHWLKLRILMSRHVSAVFAAGRK